MFSRRVYPRELERVVAAMPGVERVAVTPVPGPVRENGIQLRIRGSVTEAAVRAWCESRLSACKQPTLVEIVGVA